mmetsp:Transcript_25329/g.30665  ORF Transcript_25329/g.30665 Transcript_25329/m.30665 type:complete len:149 (-) Transcript_25329:239-685(-)|eukprot:CAMPEP_0172495162 /NCGR_PEP_ID=MMETSP1066-20121228/64186_1 /TAXON_ID=671091 /ORGANISM="Coscinodiscus wailesii, Strain CCMP2513" /LENGTH=148 /DNA_ID=CAMNT_0013266653 /DNA_START=64 /DNA_END=510 /DNA_ORIENTATION=+
MASNRRPRRAAAVPKEKAPVSKKPTAKAKVGKKTEKKAPEPERQYDPSLKTVTIEACKSSSVFKTRANKIMKAIGEKANIEMNKEKPKKGNFVISVSGYDKPIVELLDLKAPLTELKELDCNEVAKKVLAAIEGNDSTAEDSANEASE